MKAPPPIRRLWRSFPAAGLVVLAIVISLHSLNAQERFWDNSAGGLFDDDENWLDDLKPGPGEDAVFDLAGESFTVDFSGVSPENDQLLVRNGVVTFDLQTQTYELTNPGAGGNSSVRLAHASDHHAELHLSNGTLHTIGASEIARGPSGTFGLAVVGAGGIWQSDDTFSVGRDGGEGVLIIQDGGTVQVFDQLTAGNNNGQGKVRVSGTGSSLTTSGNLRLGQIGSTSRAELIVEKGATVSVQGGNIGLAVAVHGGNHGTALITGSGSVLTASDIQIGRTDGTSDGFLHIHDHARVDVEGDVETHPDSSEISLRVTNNEMLNIDDDFNHAGYLLLTADPRLNDGDYTPITVGGTWSGTGTLQTVGGSWNAGDHEFSVSSTSIGEGVTETLNLTNTQRLQITGNLDESLTVSFDPLAEAESGGSQIDFRADTNPVEWINGWQVLGAWDFTTDLADGSLTQLSFDVDLGWEPDLFELWHSVDGSSWSSFTTDIFYEDAWASFYVTEFSSYALTVIPEPSATVLLVLAALGYLCVGRRRGSH